MKQTIALIIFFLWPLLSNAQLVTYDSGLNASGSNEFAFRSPYYKVTLTQKGVEQESFVYGMNAMHVTNNSKSTSWSSFSFEKNVKVRVKLL